MRDETSARNIIGRLGSWWRDVIVVAATLVIGPDEQRFWPRLAVHDSPDDLGAKALALADVLRVLLGVLVVVRVDDTEVRQRSGVGVSEEFANAANVQHVPGHAERVQACGELQVALHSASHALKRPSECVQVMLRPEPPVAQEVPELGLVAGG